MQHALTAVFDVGKTMAKLSVWDAQARCVSQQVRANHGGDTAPHAALDVAGIENFLADALARARSLGDVRAIVPVGHGAAAAVIRDEALCAPVADYEHPIPPALCEEYARLRDPFANTGSPRLPNGLNLGAQLHCLESRSPAALAGDAQILPWPQFWAWTLCGTVATEVSSLGCHSDLWNPFERRYSDLAVRRGWAARFAPLRAAGEMLGTLRDDWVRRTGLAPTTQVYCGLHDSNAALLAARGLPEFAGRDFTVVSTGTWFVALRSPDAGTAVQGGMLDEARDCLANVDVDGRIVPSARFMGGREIMLLDPGESAAAPAEALAAAVVADAMVLPTQVAGVGPFGTRRGGWVNEPADAGLRRAAVGLYAAMVTGTMLDLVGARGRVLIEGRFAADPAFTQALATLRTDLEIWAGEAAEGVAIGALRLLDPSIRPAASPQRVAPLDLDLHDYHARWLQRTTHEGTRR